MSPMPSRRPRGRVGLRLICWQRFGQIHLHFKDVRREADRWRLTAIGAGEIDYDAVLVALTPYPDLRFALNCP